MLHEISLIKISAKTVDEDPAGYKDIKVGSLQKRSNQPNIKKPYQPSSGLPCNICKPEEGWYGQPKYCYEKTIHVFLISFAVLSGLLLV